MQAILKGVNFQLIVAKFQQPYKVWCIPYYGYKNVTLVPLFEYRLAFYDGMFISS